jgi:hypothetical protein
MRILKDPQSGKLEAPPDHRERGRALSCWWWGSVAFPGSWWAEWSGKHPFGVSPCSWRDAMTMCPGTGLLSQMIERGLVAGSCRMGERARGLVTLPVCGCAVAAQAAPVGGAAGLGVLSAWAPASRW